MNPAIAAALSDLTPTEEQERIIKEIRSPLGSAMITAYAGCSKTTTLQLAAPGIRVPALALAFNRKIADELIPRLPSTFTVKTLNGLGHLAWMRGNPNMGPVKVEPRKLGKLVSEIGKEAKAKMSTEQWEQARGLVTAAMGAGLVPGNEGQPLIEDSPEAWGALADSCWIPELDQPFLIGIAQEALRRSIELSRKGTISYDDQIYCSVCLGGRFPQFPVVFVDEAQDLSPLNHEMIKKVMYGNARLVAVGDPKQAIYGWRGADTRSMENLRGLRPSEDWTNLPLATTFRCPKVVVARNASHAPGFTAWHTNPEGSFARLDPFGVEGPWTWGDVMARLPRPETKLAILCRNNAPLMSLAFKLLRNGIGVVIQGRDFGKGLVTLCKKIVPEDSVGAADTVVAINTWRDHESDLARANGKEEKLESISDQAECLLAVLESASARSAGELRELLANLFARELGLVTLSSIHRSKGLEWDVVLHLDPWRIPSKSAKREAAEGRGEALEQEYNLKYVAETRSRHTLLEGSLSNFQFTKGEG